MGEKLKEATYVTRVASVGESGDDTCDCFTPGTNKKHNPIDAQKYSGRTPTDPDSEERAGRGGNSRKGSVKREGGEDIKRAFCSPLKKKKRGR